MAKIDIPSLVPKKRGTRTYYYWQPSGTLRKAGWKSIPLGTDLRAAMKAAEAENDKVVQWRNGGAAPRAVRKFIKGGTMDQLIARYSAEILPTLAANTQREYRSKLRIISRWAGPEQVTHINRKRIAKLRDVLLKPDAAGTVAANRAAGTMRVLVTLMKFAINADFLPEGTINPASGHNVPTPAPRDQVWSPDAVDLFVAAAKAAGQPGLALAILLARESAQREADLLTLSIRQWLVIPRHKLNPEDWERLAEPNPDGAADVRGIRVRQGKTKRWIEVPIVGETRRLIEQAVADARAASSTVLLLERRQEFDGVQRSGDTWLEPFTETRFQRAIAALRIDAATAARAIGDEDLATEIEDLQFRDLRRTAVVWLGELGLEDHLIAALTGHKLDYTRKILETYMPRTTKMAGKAVALRRERGTETPAAIERSLKA